LEVREEVRLLARPLAEESGLELVDVEFQAQGRRRVVRVLIDRPGGITVDECARFSRKLSDCLDMNQTLANSYNLEVSSPGIDRPLRTGEHYERFKGERAALTTHEPLDGRRHWSGRLLGLHGQSVGLELEEGGERWFELAQIKQAHLVVDPWRRERAGGGAR
jgi:ribosome maturation factor RimP